MRLVLDTNVIVSGLLSPEQSPAQILRLVLNGKISILHDPRILLEYERVLLRPKFNFPKKLVFELIHFLQDYGESIVAAPLHLEIPDLSDAPFIEIALSGKAEYLITGNLKHFPRNALKGLTVFSPTEFVRAIS